MTGPEAGRAPTAAAEILIAQMQQCWTLPLMITACWWQGYAEALWPRPPHVVPHHPGEHDEHEQLAVPDPIAETGDSLFA